MELLWWFFILIQTREWKLGDTTGGAFPGGCCSRGWGAVFGDFGPRMNCICRRPVLLFIRCWCLPEPQTAKFLQDAVRPRITKGKWVWCQEHEGRNYLQDTGGTLPFPDRNVQISRRLLRKKRSVWIREVWILNFLEQFKVHSKLHHDLQVVAPTRQKTLL